MIIFPCLYFRVYHSVIKEQINLQVLIFFIQCLSSMQDEPHHYFLVFELRHSQNNLHKEKWESSVTKATKQNRYHVYSNIFVNRFQIFFIGSYFHGKKIW